MARSNAQVTIVVESLPDITPSTDSIFITGSFNDWRVNDPDFLLKKQLDGKLIYRFEQLKGPIEYKFTRGSWMKVETSTANEYLPNRTLIPTESSKYVYVSILNWQDLGGARSLPLMSFYYFTVAFLATFLLFFVHRIPRSEAVRIKAFRLLNAFLILSFSTAVILQIANVIWLTYVEMAFHVLVFAWGPVMLLLIWSFDRNPFHRRNVWFFAPALLMVVVAVMRINNLHFPEFMNVETMTLNTGSAIALGLGMGLSLVFFIVSWKTVRELNKDQSKAIAQFAPWLFWTNLATWSVVILCMLSYLAGWESELTDKCLMVFLVGSSLILLEMYYLWKFPEIMRERTVSSLEITEDLVLRLERLMSDEQVFKNANLNLKELSELLEIRSHLLSRILNEHYGKSFRDFVNSYRIAEFIVLAEKGQLEKFTYLALAHQVGFNSKSTFNLAFKKHTDQNPREYFKLKQD